MQEQVQYLLNKFQSFIIWFNLSINTSFGWKRYKGRCLIWWCWSKKDLRLAEENLPGLGYKKRAHMMNNGSGLTQGGKMSASDQNSKRSILLKEPKAR